MKRTKPTQAVLLERGNNPVNLVPEEEVDTPDALLNDVVLQNIFKFLSFEDLWSCRQVGNSTWLKNTMTYWWSRNKLVCRSDGETREKFMDFLRHPEVASKATSFEFNYVNLMLLTNFWTNFGQSIKHLVIRCGHFSSPENFRHIIFSQCPNLEKLVFVGPTVFYEEKAIAEPLEWENPPLMQNTKLKYFESSLDLPISWLEFLSHFPGLEALKVRTRRRADIYKTISIVRQHNCEWLKLKHIDIRCELFGEYDNSVRDILLVSKLPLEKLFIHRSICQPETLENILKLHGKSLKELSVRGSRPGYENRALSLAEPIENLEKLEVTKCLFTADIFKNIPNVRKVKLEYSLSLCTFSPDAASNLKISSCTELSLRIHKPKGDEHKQDLEFFMNVFPNVEKLEVIDINNSQFSSICQRWKGLKYFDCDAFSHVDVTGLLGYDPDTGVSNGVRRPNITDLADLQHFVMICRDGLEMKHARLLLRELQVLRKLNKFQVYGTWSIEDRIWHKINAKYSGRRTV